MPKGQRSVSIQHWSWMGNFGSCMTISWQLIYMQHSPSTEEGTNLRTTKGSFCLSFIFQGGSEHWLHVGILTANWFPNWLLPRKLDTIRRNWWHWNCLKCGLIGKEKWSDCSEGKRLWTETATVQATAYYSQLTLFRQVWTTYLWFARVHFS